MFKCRFEDDSKNVFNKTFDDCFHTSLESVVGKSMRDYNPNAELSEISSFSSRNSNSSIADTSEAKCFERYSQEFPPFSFFIMTINDLSFYCFWRK